MKLPAAVKRIHLVAVIVIGLGMIFSVGFAMTAAAAESDLTLGQILDRMEARYTDNSFKAEFAQESTIKAMISSSGSSSRTLDLSA